MVCVYCLIAVIHELFNIKDKSRLTFPQFYWLTVCIVYTKYDSG